MESNTLKWSELLDDLYSFLHSTEIEEYGKDENVDIEFVRKLNKLKLRTLETKKMLTMDWKGFQDRRPKPIKRKVKKNKNNDSRIRNKKSFSKSSKIVSRKEEYYQELEHPLWKEKRLLILKRDRFQCRLCGSRQNLVVHHIKYSDGKRAWQYPNLDLITLCKDCHSMVHEDKNHELNPFRENC